MSKLVKQVAAIGLAIGALALAPVVGGALAFAAAGFGASAALITGTTILAGVGLSLGAAFVGQALGLNKTGRVNPAAIDRLTASLDPQASRKMVVGRTAMATDVRYQRQSDDGVYLTWVVGCACHKVEAIEELWLDSVKAWTASGGVTGDYSGYLTVTVVTEGASGAGTAIDSNWTTASSLTGCAYLVLKFKLTGNSKKAESPFSQRVPTRLTVRGKGMPLPDLREDGVDAADQATWDWVDDDSGNNPALQLLAYLLGWRINDEVSVGCGLPPARLDLDSFVTAANMCDEPVTLAAGGTQPRYRSAGIIGDDEAPGEVMDRLCAAMNAVLRDDGGRLSLVVLHDDLDDPDAISLGPDDILGNESWRPAPDKPVPNIVRGRWTDPSDESLYQLAVPIEQRITSRDGINRVFPFDAPMVQDAAQFQRLLKQKLQRLQYQGEFSADFGLRAWLTSVGRIVKLTHPSLGWQDKKFRVKAQGIRRDGVCPLVLVEESPDIYAWDAEEAAPVVPATPTVYDPSLDPIRQAIDDISPAFIQPDPPSAAISRPGTIWLDSDSEPVAYRAYRRVPDPGLLLDNLGNPVLDDEGEPIEAAWTEAELSPADLARWTDITGAGKPEDNADVTAALAGQTALTIAADYTGADLAGELPRTDRYTLTRGGVDVSASSSWTATLVEGDWTGSIDDGLLTTTALGSDTALVDITASYGGFARPPLRVTLTRQYGAAPIGGEGGSSSGGTLVSVPPNGSITSATMAVVSPILAPVVGDAGKVRLSVSLTVSTAPTDLGIYPVAAVLQQNVADVWTDIDTETMSDPHCEVLAVIDESGALRTVKGRLRLGATIEGLTPGDEPGFRLRARNVSGTRTMTLAGTITADGTVS